MRSRELARVEVGAGVQGGNKREKPGSKESLPLSLAYGMLIPFPLAHPAPFLLVELLLSTPRPLLDPLELINVNSFISHHL